MFRIFQFLLAACCLLARSSGAEASLPRVLVIGDEIYREPVKLVERELKGRVELVRRELPRGVVLTTGSLLEHLDPLLGTDKWDVIHFNTGLGDLIHRAPGMKSFRVMPIDQGGVRATDPATYEANLRELVRRLKPTGAKLVWASTTPIRSSTTRVFLPGSETEYNAIAARVMDENGIAINDMNLHVRSLIDMNKPAAHGADPFDFDRKPIHEPVVKAILAQLGMP